MVSVHFTCQVVQAVILGQAIVFKRLYEGWIAPRQGTRNPYSFRVLVPYYYKPRGIAIV